MKKIKVGDYEIRVQNGKLVAGATYEYINGKSQFDVAATIKKSEARSLLKSLDGYAALQKEIDRAKEALARAEQAYDALLDELDDLEHYDDIDTYKVKIRSDGVEFGCTFVPAKTVKRLVNLLK